MANVPFSTVRVLNCALVAFCLATTSAPGITAPDGSTTTPESDDVACPKADTLSNKTKIKILIVFFTIPSHCRRGHSLRLRAIALALRGPRLQQCPVC